MTTSTDGTEKGYIINQDSILPEYHTVDTYYKLGSNLIIVTGDSIYDHNFGQYKPELRPISEDRQSIYEVENLEQGDVLFSNILEYVIDISS